MCERMFASCTFFSKLLLCILPGNNHGMVYLYPVRFCHFRIEHIFMGRLGSSSPLRRLSVAIGVYQNTFLQNK